MLLKITRLFVFLFAAGALAAALAPAQDWPEIPKEEWALTDDPANPGASAVILYREEVINDKESFARNYYRIKILKDDGKKYGDISIPFLKGQTRIEDIEAQTVHPDGKVSSFDGNVYTKEVVKARGVNYLAETFTLPDIQPGTIIEYRYTERWKKLPDVVLKSPQLAASYLSEFGATLGGRWIVQDELSTRRAHYSFLPIPGFPVAYTSSRLPTGAHPVVQNGAIDYDAENIPAFRAEDYIPPEDMLKGRIEFFYVFGRMPDSSGNTDWFWKQLGGKRASLLETYINNYKHASHELSGVYDPSDPPDVKLHKVYDLVQRVRNLSFEPEKTAQEAKREKADENRKLSDVLKHGYGTGYEINLLFVALARAADFNAAMVEVAQRDQRFFTPQLLDWSQLTANLVVVNVDGKDRYFDPATRFCPYGLVPWAEDTTGGFRLDKDGATKVQVPGGPSSDTIISRKATLQVNDDGGVTGQFDVSFTGQDALERRLDNRDRDETGRRKELADELKGWFPSGATITINGMSGWDDGNVPLKVNFTVSVEGGRRLGVNRLLYPAMPFPGEAKYAFPSAQRALPVYIRYSYQQVDEFTLRLPPSLRVESLPAPRMISNAFGGYELTLEDHGGAIAIRRHFTLQEGVIQPAYYPDLRGFLTSVRQGDEAQLVLQSTAPPAAGGR